MPRWILYLVLVLVALTLVPMGLLYRSMHSTKTQAAHPDRLRHGPAVLLQAADRGRVLPRRPGLAPAAGGHGVPRRPAAGRRLLPRHRGRGHRLRGRVPAAGDPGDGGPGPGPLQHLLRPLPRAVGQRRRPGEPAGAGPGRGHLDAPVGPDQRGHRGAVGGAHLQHHHPRHPQDAGLRAADPGRRTAGPSCPGCGRCSCPAMRPSTTSPRTSGRRSSSSAPPETAPVPRDRPSTESWLWLITMFPACRTRRRPSRAWAAASSS